MSGLGKNLAERAHYVQAVAPVDITGGVTGKVFSMRHHNHATIKVGVGVSVAAFTKIIVNRCDDFAGANPVPIPYRLYAAETPGSDVLGPREEVAATGRTPTAGDDIFYQIELAAEDIGDGKEHVRVDLTNGANSVIAGVDVLLHGARYGSAQSETETA